MEIRKCRNCLDYDNCMEGTDPYDFPTKLKERLYDLFVEGCDCFIQSSFDEE